VGGRRARSLREIVGTGVAAQSRQLSKAISEENPKAVATSSAQLLAKSKKTVDTLYYVSQLADFVKKIVESGRDLPYEERVTLARQEWSRIKKQENLDDDPIVTNAIVSAAAKAIAKGRK
jgi:hypothetical protein